MTYFGGVQFEDLEGSQFNSGLAIVYFIDGLKKALVQCRVTKDYENMYEILVSYFTELAGSMKESKENTLVKEEHLKYWEQCKASLYKYKEYESKGKLTQLKRSDFEIFDWWEFKLKELQQKIGIGMPKTRDGRTSMME